MSLRRKRSDRVSGRHAAVDADGHEPEIRVPGHDRVVVVWWERRLVIEHHGHWHGHIEITPDACERAEYSHRDLGDHSELVLSIRLQAGNRSLLCGVLDIAVPLEQEHNLQLLVGRVNAELHSREHEKRPAGELVAQVPPVLPHPAAPPPVRPERERPPQPATPEPPAEHVLPTTATPAPEPRVRDEPPRLRQLAFLQAPDDDEWITFCPLRTADDVRAPIPVQEHG